MENQLDTQIREQLIKHLKGGEAFMSIDRMIKKVQLTDIHIVPEGLPYSFYQLF